MGAVPKTIKSRPEYVVHKYGEHDLQRVAVWKLSELESVSRQCYWIIFLHGGAWRDPRNTMTDFAHCVNYMLSTPDKALSSICGFASLDHRLSPHPDFPQDPENTPANALRIAKHPDHLADVRTALYLLQREYGIKSNYIFIGHSSGATLGYQLLMGNAIIPPSVVLDFPDIHLPDALIGIYGIYDPIELNRRYNGEYSGFLNGAFGDDPDIWRLASPSRFEGSLESPAQHCSHGAKPVIAMLVDSPDDKLLDSEEVAAMKAKLVHDGIPVKLVDTLVGDHNHVWKEPSQLAELISQCLQVLHNCVENKVLGEGGPAIL